MADNSSNNLGNVKCSVFDTKDYVTVAIISACSAFVSSLLCIFVISLILMLKKYVFFIQRLVLYLSITALINSLSIVLRLYRIGYQLQSQALTVLCIAAAFIDQTSMWSLFMAFTAITFTLLMTVVFHKNTSRLEWVYVVMIFLSPLLFNWIPFIGDTYGQSGAWCWIRNVNYDDNCTEHGFGTVLQYVLWYIPAYVLLFVLVLVYIFIIICVVRQKMRKYDNEETIKVQNTLHQEVLPLLFYPIGLFLLNVFPLANRVQASLTTDDPIRALWVLHAVFSPLQGGYIALVYILDRDTLKRLTGRNLLVYFRRDDGVKEYPASVDDRTESVSQSVIKSQGKLVCREEPIADRTDIVYKSLDS